MMKEFADKYLDIIKNDFGTINLTRILDSEEFYAKQVLDSVIPLDHSPTFEKKIISTGLVVDIGFGCGVPILPLAYKFPSVKFVGFEARKKKADVVRQIANKLGLSNVSLFHHRIEDVILDREAVLTLKAVGDIEKMCQYFFYTKNITIYYYKGPQFERKEQLSAIEADWRLFEHIKYPLGGTEGRELVGLEPKKVPRGTSKKDKFVVKLSEII